MHFSLKFLLGIMILFSGLTNAFCKTKNIEQKPEELIKLAKNMEDFGYLKSAEHYYRLAYRNPTINQETRKQLDKTLNQLTIKIKHNTHIKKPLANLENLPHFKTNSNKKYTTSGITKRVVSASNETSNEFPSPRINKKRWFLASLAIVGIALVINKKIQDDKKTVDNSTPNSIVIGF
jgi:hypothetical protein